MKRGTLVLPAYNEAENIPLSLKRIESAINEVSNRLNLDMLIIDDGSTDQTSSLLDNYKNRFENKISIIQHKVNRGVVYSVKEGYRIALDKDYDYIIKTDLDRDFDQKEVITSFCDHLLRGVPAVFGVRWREITREENPLEHELRRAIVEEVEKRFSIKGLDPPSVGSQGFERKTLNKLLENTHIKNYEKRWGLDMVVPIITKKIGIPNVILKFEGKYDPKRRPRDKVLSQYSIYWSNIQEL